MNRRRITRVSLLSAVVLGLFLAAGTLDVRIDWRRSTARALDLFGEEQPPTGEDGDDQRFWIESGEQSAMRPPVRLPNFADLAERISPAVVNINTSKTVVRRRFQNPFEEFFGIPKQPFGGPREFQAESLGSGFVISPDGYILTNNHVVGDVDSITVTFENGTELEAEVVGRDPKTDVALIRVEATEPLQALPLGDSDKVRPGDWVVAIGNPFGFEHTVTAGIVSGKHRIIGQGSYDDFIQTDAAINPGNSGGPLINLAGEAIGINTAINPRANTMGFAVPVNMAKTILPQLRTKGHAVRGWLGVGIQKITPELVETLELDDEKGALVSQVFDESPASEAGFERSDVIVEFDGQPIESMEQLPRIVASTPVGKSVGVVVLRDGKRKHLKVKVGELDEPQIVASLQQHQGASEFGFTAQNVTPEVAEQLGLSKAEGVVITEVQPGSPAAQAGLRREDVILEVAREPVPNVAEMQTKLDAGGDKALLLIRRGGSTVFVPLKK